MTQSVKNIWSPSTVSRTHITEPGVVLHICNPSVLLVMCKQRLENCLEVHRPEDLETKGCQEKENSWQGDGKI